jgi:hypothetical protein
MLWAGNVTFTKNGEIHKEFEPENLKKREYLRHTITDGSTYSNKL